MIRFPLKLGEGSNHMLKNSENENPSLSSTVETSKSRFLLSRLLHFVHPYRVKTIDQPGRVALLCVVQKTQNTDFEQTKY